MPSTFSPDDERFMRMALALAARGQGTVEPNPMVGCVLVHRGRVVSRGWHRRYGGPHAEVEALHKLKRVPRGLTAYVTLEPCCHFGKTPPCTNALIAAGVQRVVAAMLDPGPHVSGNGVRQLRVAGIRVDVGLLEADARALNRPYLKRLRTGRPWVILKWAQSLDGRLATRAGDSRWITGPAARREVHRLRARVDAILVGVGTLLADDPKLTARGVPVARRALRVVLDSRLRLPLTAHMTRTARRNPTRVYCTSVAPAARFRRLEAAGVEVVRVRARGGRVALAAVLDDLGRRGASNLLVEGGAEVLGSFLDDGLADELRIHIAPRVIGGRTAPGAVGGRGPARLADALALTAFDLRRLGSDLELRAILKA